MNAFDKLPQDKLKGITESLKGVTSRFHGTYFQRLWDTRQTHAIYGVTESTLDILKEQLTKIGANKFRKVKANGQGFWILCFSAEKIK